MLDRGKFTAGSTMRHVVVMTATGSVGLMAIFAVDLLTLLYISMLKDEVLTAAVGYAALINFFALSISIGVMIATTALTARFLGAGDRLRASDIATSAVGWSVVVSFVVSVVMLLFSPTLLQLIGAKDRAFDIAYHFLLITLPSGVLMAIGMSLSGVLRAVGDANRAMYVTLAGGIATAIFDPILIFALDLGVTGAAITIVVSRLVFAYVGWHGACRIHDLVGWPRLPAMLKDGPAIFNIAMPAVLTNIATPVANAFLIAIIGQFGEKAVAAATIIDRLTPVAFGALFALSGGVGPILSQNYGARQFARMNRALRDALVFSVFYVLFTWAILFLARDAITTMFHATGETADYVKFFCLISGIMWMFNGFLFTANAAFNNLGFPIYSTVFNWLRATLGVVPFAHFGAAMAGFKGAMTGVTIGSLIFGAAALVVVFRQVAKLGANAPPAPVPARALP
ncbi:MAG: MATE family efflux transporter [Beijerinckiaceae bacterium]|nr:MATE family efflux transporter [Beijerinckiaceae bacterium]